MSINVINKKGQVQAEVKRYKMDFPVYIGRGHQLTSLFKIKKLPHLFIVDQQGMIRSSKRFLSAKEIKKIVDQLLKDEPKKSTKDDQ